MKKAAVFFIILTLVVGFGFAQKAQKIYTVDSDVYKTITHLYYTCGYAVPSASGPWSEAELEMMAANIDPSRLSGSELEEYNYVIKELSSKADIDTGIVGFDFGFKSFLEAYVQTDGENYKNRTDWVFDMSAERPFANIPIEVYADDHFYLDFDLSLAITYQPDGGFGKYNTNLPYINKLDNYTWQGFKNVDVSANIPQRAMLSAGSKYWNFTIGRDRLSWGQGKTGNTMVSDNLPYYDFARFTLFSPKFKYSFLVSSFPNKLDYYAKDKNENWYFSGTDSSNDGNILMKGINLYFAHRFETRLFEDKLALALTEGLMYSDSNGSLRYAVLNPMTFMHDFFMGSKSNSSLGVEASYTPVKNLNIYGQFMFDEIIAPVESNKSNSAFAFVGGAEYNIPLGQKVLTVCAEGAYVSPYTYLRDSGNNDNNLGLDYIVATRMYSLQNGVFYDQYVLGYPYGPDCIVGMVSVECSEFKKYSFGSKVMLLVHGKNNMNTVYKSGDGSTTPSTGTSDSYIEKYGTNHTEVEYRGIIGFDGSYQLNNWLNMYGEVDFIAVKNMNNIDSNGVYKYNTQVVVGAEITL